MANGVAEIRPLQPFPIRVLNTSTRERALPKGLILEHALHHPKGIVALADKTEPVGNLREPPSEHPLPDRSDIDGELWKEEMDLAHILPHERERVLR
jgi:hypothetical protein